MVANAVDVSPFLLSYFPFFLSSHMERAKFEYAVKLVLSASEQTVEHLQRLADNVRAAAALVDAPTSEMNCNE